MFKRPLKAVNVGISEEPYDACPYCLTEITSKAQIPLEDLPKEQKPLPKEAEPAPSPSTKSPGCRNYFGFLSERSSKKDIPDECMMCREIVQCMLKKA